MTAAERDALVVAYVLASRDDEQAAHAALYEALYPRPEQQREQAGEQQR